MNVIDLFSGCGGLSLGFLKAGYTVKKAVEFDIEIAKTYQKNHPSVTMIAEDIRDVDQSGIFVRGDADIIIGGPPCQGFSMAGARIREGIAGDDPRNYLFQNYFNVVKTVRPKAFVIENVKGILTLHGGKIFDDIVRVFSDPDHFDGKPYYLHYRLMKATEFGIPQARERVVIIGAQYDFDFDLLLDRAKARIITEYPHYFEPVTVWDAISNLPSPTEDGTVVSLHPKTNYQAFLSANGNHHGTTNHVKSLHSAKAVERMRQIKIDQNYTVLSEQIHSVHSGAYGRLNPDSVAPTVTTRFDTPSGGRFIHPYEDRTITPREAARLQSFPDDFEFVGTKTSICRQIGNAVPPKLAYLLAKMIEELDRISEVD